MKIIIGEKELGPEFVHELRLAVENRVGELKKIRKKNEDEGLFRAVEEVDDRLRLLRGGDGESGLLHFLDDQVDAFEDAGQMDIEDEAQTAGTQTIDEALDDPTFQKTEPATDGTENTRTPFDDDDEAMPWERDPIPLTSAEQINPTMLAIISDAGITTLEAMAAAGRDTIADLKGIGPAKMEKLDEALQEAGLEWVTPEEEEEEEAEEEPVEAEAEAAAEDETEEEPVGPIETDTGAGPLNPDSPTYGDIVVPDKNRSFELEVTGLGDPGGNSERVYLKPTGAAREDPHHRYTTLRELAWDPEEERWIAEHLYLVDRAQDEEEAPAGEPMPV